MSPVCELESQLSEFLKRDEDPLLKADQQFCLSLVPGLNALDEVTKFKTKARLMEVLADALHPPPPPLAPLPPQHCTVCASARSHHAYDHQIAQSGRTVPVPVPVPAPAPAYSYPDKTFDIQIPFDQI